MNLSKDDKEEYLEQMRTLLKDVMILEDHLGQFVILHGIQDDLVKDVSVDSLAHIVHKLEYFIKSEEV